MKEIGLSLAEIEEAPAVELDWLLAVHDVFVKAEREREAKHAGQGGGPRG